MTPRKSKGTANRAAAGEQRGHPRRISAALSRPQKRAAEHQRIGESVRHQPHHRLQIQEPFGSVKMGSRDWLPISSFYRPSNCFFFASNSS